MSQCGADGVVEARGEALVAQRGGAGESGHGEVRAAGGEPEGAGRLLFVLHEAVAAEDVELLGLVAVDAYVEGIAVEDALAGGDVVGNGAADAGDVGQRNGLQQIQRLRREQIRRDDVAGELLAVGGNDVAIGAVAGVVDRGVEVAQIAGAFGGGGHAREQRVAVVLAVALIIAEVEGLVLLNRTAEGAAELIPQRGRNEPAVGADDRLGLREGIARGAMLVAAVFEEAAVQRVGAGLGLRGDDRLAGLSEFGVVGWWW